MYIQPVNTNLSFWKKLKLDFMFECLTFKYVVDTHTHIHTHIYTLDLTKHSYGLALYMVM
jgi:hypothetical protein